MKDEQMDVNKQVDPSSTETADDTAEQKIPYSRFKEVNDEVKILKEELQNIKTHVPEPPEEEPKTWQEVEERAVRKAQTAFQKQLNQEREADLKIDNHFKVLASLGHNLTEDIQSEILKEVVRTGNSNVIEIYTQNKTKYDNLANAAQLKQARFVPPSRSGSGTDNTPAWNYKDIKNKSLDDLIAEAS